MNIEYIKVDELKPAVYNPPGRVSGHSLYELLASVKQVGILQPILVSQSLDVIDGHRRLACAKLAGLETVPCIVTDGNRHEIYTSVNGTSKKLTLADDLYVYLSGGSMSGRSRAAIDALDKIIGLDGLETLAESGLSPRGTLQACETYERATGDKITKKSAMWIINQRMSYRIRRAKENGIHPDIIRACVNANIPLEV